MYSVVMNCSDFLELYSDYRDGLLTDPATVRHVHRHLRECARCMNYDALVSRGVMTLRSINEIKPASKLEPALFHQSERIRSQTRMAPVIAVAALLGVLLTAGAMLLLEGGAGAVDSGLASTAPEGTVSQPQTKFAVGRVQIPDSVAPFVRTDPGTPLITFTDLGSPAGTETVESFATWVTLSR